MLKVRITLPAAAAPPAAVKVVATAYQRRFSESRKAAKVTLQQLGAAVGLTPQAVSQFELGKSSISLVNFLRACLALGLRTEWVLSGEGRQWAAGPAPVVSARKRAAGRAPQPAAGQ